MDPNGATLPRSGTGHSGSGRRNGGRRTPSVVLAAAGLVLGAVAVLARYVRRVEVVGGSMAPALLEGDRLLLLAVRSGVRVDRGDVVAVADPRDPQRVLVKRVAQVDRARATVEVLGDAADASTDSRTFGPVPFASVVGRAVYRYGPQGRTGPLGRPTEYDLA